MEALESTSMVDADHPAVRAFAAKHSDPANDARTNAVSLYYAVRDGFRYDPYGIDLSVKGLAASTVLEIGHGWCVSKAALLAACCRAIGIPAKLGYADVRNHLSTEKMRAQMGTDLFVWHGYTSILIDGRWLKATPAFNIELCEKFRLHALEFDGTEDSIYHPFDLDGHEHMEYVQFRGEFNDIPLDEMLQDFRDTYPNMRFDENQDDFDRDVAAETN